MCRIVQSILSTVLCVVQMLVRVFLTIILMLENLIRMILQSLYNFISFILQMLSLIPICIVFLLTAKLKCLICGGGMPCPLGRGRGCDFILSAIVIVSLFFIFRATGFLDKIFYSIGYAPAHTHSPTDTDTDTTTTTGPWVPPYYKLAYDKTDQDDDEHILDGATRKNDPEDDLASNTREEQPVNDLENDHDVRKGRKRSALKIFTRSLFKKNTHNQVFGWTAEITYDPNG